MNTLILTALTVIVYIICKQVFRERPFPLLHPLLFSPLVLIGLITCFHISADQYIESSRWISHMLAPATVAFAIPMYKHRKLLKKYMINIMISITLGSVVAIISSLALSLLLKLKPDLIISILPRSITTPIAIEVSKEIGGLPALTTVFVICTGIIGGIIGPSAITWLSIKSPIAKGLALGMGAHGVGTSKAREYGEQEATFSTLAMIFAAMITMVWGSSLIPVLIKAING
ncbi:LrgB family protein [Peribacillus sp. SCS-155]|uniref:LrgB family protein n=1 Tax=Peribacillus sedimenti TaxID=3115297 RepID=UPI003906C5FF